MHTPDTAARTILSHLHPLEPLPVPLDQAVGQVLAEAVTSPIDLPPWDNSAMDGYALQQADLAAGTREFEIIEEIPAGTFPAHPVVPGRCARIFTGAPIPEGADTVVRQEDTERAGDRVRVTDIRDAGRNVRRRGEDVTAGAVVLDTGTALGPAQVGVLTSIVHAEPLVHRRPRVAILTSGDEIVDLDRREEVLAGRKIASSNSHTLAALARGAGAVVDDLGIARDDPADLRARIERAHGADLLVTSAGISVGEHDHLHTVLDELHATDRFWRIRMRPGAPVGFGRIGQLGGLPWIGLPGNPVSTMVTFELFVRPAIRRLLGHPAVFHAPQPAVTTEPISLGPRLRHFLRVRRADPDDTDGPPAVTLTGAQGSGILTSMARADALLIVPEDTPEVAAGARMRAIFLDAPRFRADVTY